MATVTINGEFTTSVSAQRMFKALVIDAHNLFPKLTNAVKSVELIEGSGGPGTMKTITFAEGVVVKHRVDAIDEGSLSAKFTMLEGSGDGLVEKFDHVIYENKFETTSDGGCMCKHMATYYPKGGVELNQDEIKAGKDKGLVMLKVVEDYLVANPQEYA